MSDFDFEELDKAVTGAIGGDVSLNTPANQPATAAQNNTTSAREETPAVQPIAVPAARRGSGGRFMDMVHPSSDMRSGNAAPVKVSAPAPTSVTTSPPAPAAELAHDAPLAPSTPAGFVPLPDVPQFEKDWSKPLESPFLPDAKVEKRPLGGTGDHSYDDFAAAARTPEAPAAAAPAAATTIGDYLADEPEEELLEASDELLLTATAMPDPIDFSAHNEVHEHEDTGEAQHAPAATDHAVDGPELHEELAGPPSITQQYKEQPQGEQESGAIYDTEAYHQPLAHPPKKHSGAWVFLWIFLLVVLGAAAGAAFYLFVMPML